MARLPWIALVRSCSTVLRAHARDKLQNAAVLDITSTGPVLTKGDNKSYVDVVQRIQD